jgi:hypothetical protein
VLGRVLGFLVLCPHLGDLLFGPVQGEHQGIRRPLGVVGIEPDDRRVGSVCVWFEGFLSPVTCAVYRHKALARVLFLVMLACVTSSPITIRLTLRRARIARRALSFQTLIQLAIPERCWIDLGASAFKEREQAALQ